MSLSSEEQANKVSPNSVFKWFEKVRGVRHGAREKSPLTLETVRKRGISSMRLSGRDISKLFHGQYPALDFLLNVFLLEFGTSNRSTQTDAFPRSLPQYQYLLILEFAHELLSH